MKEWKYTAKVGLPEEDREFNFLCDDVEEITSTTGAIHTHVISKEKLCFRLSGGGLAESRFKKEEILKWEYVTQPEPEEEE